MTHDFTDAMERKISIETTNRGEQLIREKRFADALAFYNGVIQKHSHELCSGARQQRIICCTFLKNWSLVVDDATRLIDSHHLGVQWQAKMLESRGKAYLELKKFALAGADFKRVTELWPLNSRAYQERLKAYDLAGNAREKALARQELDRLNRDLAQN